MPNRLSPSIVQTGGVTPMAVNVNGGATQVAFGAQPCNGLDIVNDTGVTIEYIRGNQTLYTPIVNGSTRLVLGIKDASDVSVRRKDQSGTAVTLCAEAINA
jgi:hypothetical protein